MGSVGVESVIFSETLHRKDASEEHVDEVQAQPLPLLNRLS